MSTGEAVAESVLLGVVELREAKRLQAALRDKNVELTLVSNPETCASGSCAPTVELRALPGDVEVFRDFLRAERDRALQGLDVDAARLESVFDPEQPEATCPACGTRFATTNTECPDCGLGFSTARE